MSERVIVAAACKTGALIFVGVRHWDMLMHYQADAIWGSSRPDAVKQAEQGFVDNMGKFINREGAYIVAKEAEQLEGRKKTGNQKDGVLYSEDLW